MMNTSIENDVDSKALQERCVASTSSADAKATKKRESKSTKGSKSAKKVKLEHVKKEVKNEDAEESNEKEQKKQFVSLANHGALLVSRMPRWLELESTESVDPMSSNLTDLVLTTSDNRRFGVHAILLYASSSVLRSKMVEVLARTEDSKDDSIVNERALKLEDATGPDVILMLNYIYNGSLEVHSQEYDRLQTLIKHFGLIENNEPGGQVFQIPQKSSTNSFFDEVKKGDVLRTGKGGKCLVCGAEFTAFKSAKRHFVIKHQEVDDLSKLKCHLCGTQTKNQQYYEDHMRLKHNLKKSDFSGQAPKKAKKSN